MLLMFRLPPTYANQETVSQAAKVCNNSLGNCCLMYGTSVRVGFTLPIYLIGNNNYCS